MTTDHAPRLIAQQQQAAERAAVEDLQHRAAPLFWPVCLMAVAVLCCIIESEYGAYIDHYAALVSRAAEMSKQSEALAECMNGKAFSLGDEGILRCHITKYSLVPGVKS